MEFGIHASENTKADVEVFHDSQMLMFRCYHLKR